MKLVIFEHETGQVGLNPELVTNVRYVDETVTEVEFAKSYYVRLAQPFDEVVDALTKGNGGGKP